MRYPKQALASFAVLLIVAVPVQSDSGEEATKPNPATEREWNETMEALGSYSAEQRDKAVEAGRKTLDAMDERLEKMQAWTQEHWDSLSEEAREERTEMLKSMREQRNQVAEWYGAMKHGSAEAWDSTKQGFITAYDKLQSTYSSAVESFQSDDKDDETAAQ
ncbi:MAG: hypothetical protein U5R46_12165 [Gammaproteobacteria bacterium]|nr:hypothetical protein [Gammaproteobacteria bacterium]